LLLVLVTERQRAVSTEELFSVLWPGERVGTGSIRRAVLGLRRALGEHGDSQQSVRTVRGFGYQFVQPVCAASPSAPSTRATPTSVWDAGLSNLRVAETLPLYGWAAERLRDRPLQHTRDYGRAIQNATP
jgi:DNA-binding winged helix-turn-helix (wHTH) protein